MFKQANRLRKSKDIQAVYEAKKILSNALFRIHFDFAGANGPQIAVVTSRKLGKATVRNRVRRQIREALKPLITSFPDNLRLVVVIKNQTKAMEFGRLVDSLETLIKSIRY